MLYLLLLRHLLQQEDGRRKGKIGVHHLVLDT
jgi:hypothetical protein